MGVVKEVVTALERHPVSAEDLKDLKVSRIKRRGGKKRMVGLI